MRKMPVRAMMSFFPSVLEKRVVNQFIVCFKKYLRAGQKYFSMFYQTMKLIYFKNF